MATKTPTKEVEKAPFTPEFNRTFAEAAATMIAKEGTSEDILLAILEANDLDGILGGSGDVVGLDARLGEPFTVHRAELRKSDYEQGLAAYAVMFVKFDGSDDIVVMTSGAQTVVAQLIRMTQLEKLPVRCMGRKSSKPTAAGFYPVQLVQAPAPELFNPEDHEQF